MLCLEEELVEELDASDELLIELVSLGEEIESSSWHATKPHIVNNNVPTLKHFFIVLLLYDSKQKFIATIDVLLICLFVFDRLFFEL